MAVFCSVCGFQNPDGSPACLHCGRGLAPVANQPYATGTPVASPGIPLATVSRSLADIGPRFLAAFLDGLVVFAGMIPGVILLGVGIALTPERARNPNPLVWLGMLGLYGGIFAAQLWQIGRLGSRGATLGKQWMGLLVLDDRGQPLGFWKALAREFVKGIVYNVCILLALWPLWDPERQGLYDKAVGSHVYRA